MIDPKNFHIAICTLILLVPGVLNLVARIPKIWAPASLVLTIYGLFFIPFLFIIPVLGFLINSLYFISPKNKYLIISKIIVFVFGILNIHWVLTSSDYDFMYRNELHIKTVSSVNIIGWILLMAYILLDRKPSEIRKIYFTCGFWLWITWYSFPIFGELP